MAHPSEVNTAKFQVENVIYANDGFSIAYGVWEGNSKHLAVRWDGEEGKTGFPQTYGKPQWLLVPDKLSIPFVKALLDTEADKKLVLDLLAELLS